MKEIHLDAEEEQILVDMEAGHYISLKETNPSEFESMKTQLQQAAISMRQIKKPVTIRLANSDIQKIKLMAYNEGIPYQTFLSAIVHKIAEKKIELTLK